MSLIFPQMRQIKIALILLLASALTASAQTLYLLKPDRVFDGTDPSPHLGWAVLVRGDRILSAGPLNQFGTQVGNAQIVDLPGMTLLPGLIDMHSHLLLHP